MSVRAGLSDEVVERLAGPDRVEEFMWTEAEVQGAATFGGVVRCRSSVQRVRDVDGHIARHRIDSYDRQPALDDVDLADAAAVAAGHDVERAESGVRWGELHADVNTRASDRVSTEAAVDMPRQIGQPVGGGRTFEHGKCAERAIRVCGDIQPGEFDEATDPRIVVERSDDSRREAEVVELAWQLLAVGIASPP